MKLKLTIALVVLALVFGMVLAACDDGEVQTIKETTKSVSGTDVPTSETFDKNYVPYFNGNAKDPLNGVINGPQGDTSGFKAPTSGF